MDIVYIPPQDIDRVWVIAKPYVDDALAYSNRHHHSNHFRDLLKKGKLQLWILWDGKKSTTEEHTRNTKTITHKNTEHGMPNK